MSKLTRWLLFCFLVVFPFGQLTRLPLPWPEIHLYLTDVFLVCLLVSWQIWQKKKWSKPPLLKPIRIFLLVSLASLVFQPSWLGLLYWFRLASYLHLYWVIFDLKENFSRHLAGLGVSIAVLGLIQYFLWPDLTATTVWGWDPHYYRLVGTFLDPNFTGIILVLTLILLTERKNWFWWGVTYLSLALTYSRSSFLAFLTAMIWLKKFNWRLILLITLTWLFLPQAAGGEGVKLARTSTIWARWQNYQEALTMIRQNFFWGTGFQNRRIDASLLFIWVNSGIFGFLAWLYFLKKAGGKTLKKLVLGASLVAILIHSFFVNSLFYPWVLTWLMIILA